MPGAWTSLADCFSTTSPCGHRQPYGEACAAAQKSQSRRKQRSTLCSCRTQLVEVRYGRSGAIAFHCNDFSESTKEHTGRVTRVVSALWQGPSTPRHNNGCVYGRTSNPTCAVGLNTSYLLLRFCVPAIPVRLRDELACREHSTQARPRSSVLDRRARFLHDLGGWYERARGRYDLAQKNKNKIKIKNRGPKRAKIHHSGGGGWGGGG